jgi:tRNA dimethylallyltransferase
MAVKYLIIVTGPTAVGKTSLAIQLAKQFHTVIINADSRQVYREMVIGTAIPTSDQLAEVPHYFVGHKSIHEYYSASLFEGEAIELLDQLFAGHDTVVMAGGSGMYIDAVCLGIDEIPTVDPAVRKQVRKEFELIGLPGIQSRLLVSDPEYYSRVDLNNPTRILKALEIREQTGRPYSSFLTGKAKARNFSLLKIGLDLPRQDLHRRINARVDSMVSAGLLQEASGLFGFRQLNALNTVGYKELFSFFEGKCTLNEAIDKIKGHTRQYARRQLTWFRRDPAIRWFRPDETKKIMDYIREEIIL